MKYIFYYDKEKKQKLIRIEENFFQGINIDGTSQLKDTLHKNNLLVKALLSIQTNTIPTTLQPLFSFENFVFRLYSLVKFLLFDLISMITP